MDTAIRKQVVSIIDDIDDLTIATVRNDGYPQATTVSYVNKGLTIYFGTTFDSQKARNIAANNKVSLTINRPYMTWDEIEGLSISGVAVLIADKAEQDKVGTLLFKKFPQIDNYTPPDLPSDAMVLFRIEPQFVSLLDYRKGFGHTDLFEL
ncbi:MAG: pyridoxamine 5'-phosphate oxidase family protein [Hyphomicrobiaceae bacterium]